VRILAHSMGGLVVRTMALEAPETWKRMMAIPGSRVLMLGTPNHGSWAPMQVLSGDDSVGNLLTLLGAPFQEDRARALMAGFPGFLQLQAGLLDDARGLGKAATWQQLADEDQQRVVTASSWHNDPLMLNARRWGVPSQAVLTAASALWRRLDAQRGDLGAPAEDRVLLVTGRAPLTPVGYELGENGLEYLEVPDEGDGRVSMDSARLPGVRTWQASATHGALSTSRALFPGYLELLTNGTTTLLASFASRE